MAKDSFDQQWLDSWRLSWTKSMCDVKYGFISYPIFNKIIMLLQRFHRRSPALQDPSVFDSFPNLEAEILVERYALKLVNHDNTKT